jgi:putative redox protein
MKARIKWVQDVMFVAESGSGHSVVIDGAPDAGGRNMGVRPMEMMLMGLGSCSAFDVLTILKRSREQVTDCAVELDGQRAETDPKVFTAVELVYKITGKKLDPKKVERAVNLSAEKYCSASKMFAATANNKFLAATLNLLSGPLPIIISRSSFRLELNTRRQTN